MTSKGGFESVLGLTLDQQFAVLFANDTKGGEGGSAVAGSQVLMVRLEPKAKYSFKASTANDAVCRIRIVRDARGEYTASEAGSIAVQLDGCKPSK